MILDIERRLDSVVQTHFDPKWGSPFWTQRAKKWGKDPRTEVNSLADIGLLGTVPREALANSPIRDFIPKQFHDDLTKFITAETGGAAGPPARTAYSQEEFHEAFVTPFLSAAAHVHFPRDEQWLYIGPSGPHIIGKAARACAVAMGSIDPFSVDFDPRWIQKLVAGSMAHNRYVDHVLAQAEATVDSQDIGVLFATPPVLTTLGQRLSASCRERIRGIHLGGMAASDDFWAHLTSDWFPNAVALSGYGNSLAGMCPQLELLEGRKPVYYAHGDRLVLQIHKPDETGRGAVMFHRLDRSCLLPNMVERDFATAHTLETPMKGFQMAGILAPDSTLSSTPKQAGALY